MHKILPCKCGQTLENEYKTGDDVVIQQVWKEEDGLIQERLVCQMCYLAPVYDEENDREQRIH